MLLFLLRPVRCADCYRRRYIPIFYHTENWAQQNSEVGFPAQGQHTHRRSA